ncbi:hypothetical protein F1559_000112 [Cyanidiococcus yangmingshanensis]|uniref:Uncharacterized protein n=1 Tax=Cyanidiococcus yangmingshanensis TaxID=2690220 RepID=A0A7J7IES4_9RHOD|nr:hypothetical protein F1559_000112 [Cyanidiococcus yangmingshanensis]
MLLDCELYRRRSGYAQTVRGASLTSVRITAHRETARQVNQRIDAQDSMLGESDSGRLFATVSGQHMAPSPDAFREASDGLAWTLSVAIAAPGSTSTLILV